MRNAKESSISSCSAGLNEGVSQPGVQGVGLANSFVSHAERCYRILIKEAFEEFMKSGKHKDTLAVPQQAQAAGVRLTDRLDAYFNEHEDLQGVRMRSIRT